MFEWKQRISSHGAGVYGILLTILVVVAVSSAGGVSTSDGSFLRALTSTAASVLLVAVVAASLQSGHRWRNLTRHDSIRADIAAAGGLGRRLMG